MKPAGVKDNTYIDFKKEVNYKDPQFKVGDHVWISKYKNVFAKGYTPNSSLQLKKIKIQFHAYAVNDLNSEEIIGMLNGKGMIIHLMVGFIKKI